MLKLTINIEGNTESDLTFALEEVKRKVKQGFTSGMDQNDDGLYSFQVEGEEESNEICTKCGGVAGFEESPVGDLCGICDEWICQDCNDHDVTLREYHLPDGQIISEDNICKVCSKKLGLRDLKPVREL